MNDRPITEDDLHAFVDGQLDEQRHARVSDYLAANPEVAARFARYGDQRRAIRAALDPVAQQPVPSRLNMAHLAAVRQAPRRPAWQSAAAALVLVVAGGAGGWTLRTEHGVAPFQGDGDIVALAREATDSFVTYSDDRVRPVELRSDHMAEFVDWAAQRLGHRPAVPDLSQAGYRLMGGRIVATPHGPGAMLMYDNDRDSRLVILSRPMQDAGPDTMTPHSLGKVDGWTWADNGIGYSLVGGLTRDKLHPLADDIRRQIATAASGQDV